MNAIEDESATGGSRPGAGAAPEPEPRSPHTKPGFRSSASSFRRTGRSLTQWRSARRIQTTTKKGGGDIRAQWLALRAATGLANASSFRGRSLPDVRGGLDSDRQEGRKVDPSSPPHEGTSGRYSVLSAQADAGNSGTLPAADGGSDLPPDISGEFQSEMAALRAFYAARVGAARRSLSAGDVAAVVQALMNEQTVALRGLAERWRAATQRQQAEKPQRPTGNVQRKGDPKPS